MSSIKVSHGSSHKYAVQGKRTKDALSKEEQDLFELCCLAGLDISPAVFRIVLNLLRMNVSPVAVVQMLKSMVQKSAKSLTTSTLNTASNNQKLSLHVTEPAKNGSTALTSGALKTKENHHSGKMGMKTTRSGQPLKYLHKT